jgi:aryl-alcohol dehydrogenase-like predicted oxidoreductase
LGEGVRVPLGDDGTEIFPLILGGAEFGWNVDLESSHEILDTYVELGGNAVHTADSFSGGRSEHIIGQWVHSRGLRDDIVLAARVGGHPDNPGLGPVNLVRSVEASLTRLRTDRIDVLYLDATADKVTPLEDTLATAEWLVESGKARAVGAVGYTAAQLVEARIFSSAGFPRITVLDVPFNVVRRHEFDDDLRLVAGAQGMSVTPSHALEHGFLAGRHRTRLRGTLSVRGAQIAANLNRRGSRTLRALDEVGSELGVPDAAVAVAWLLAQKLVTAPIVNAYAAQHVEELVQGVGVRLSRGQLADIARASE